MGCSSGSCVSRLACLCPRGDTPKWGSDGMNGVDGYLAEALTLLPPCLATLVELEQREHRDCDGHAILAAHRLLEGKVAAFEQRAQAIEALSHGDALNRDMAQVDRGRHAQQPPDRRSEHRGVLFGIAGLNDRLAQMGSKRRAGSA